MTQPDEGAVGPVRDHSSPLQAAMAALLVCSIALAAGLVAHATGVRQATERLDASLQVLSRSIDSEIERFRYLPAVMARDSRIIDVLRSADTSHQQAANAYLEGVRSDSSVGEAYIIATTGDTIAASNHAETSSFVGQNYRFRPYFQEALTKGAGQYYAVGVTTGEPGYFLSSAVRDAGRTIGVAVVKVDLRPLEEAWREAGAIHAISDREGVLFLASVPGWRYRALTPLTPDSLSRIEQSRKYDGVDLTGTAPLFPTGASGDTIDVGGVRHLLRSASIEGDGWRLWSGASLSPIRNNAWLIGTLAGFAAALIVGAGFFLRQRRLLLRAKLDQHDLLERRVIERTAELREAQTSLVQAGKLAAIGQMSATIVHEVSQPLAAMENTLAATGLLADRGDTVAVAAKVSELRSLVRRIQRTVKSLKSFARKEPPLVGDVDVGKAVDSAVELAEHRSRASGVPIHVQALDRPLFAKGNSLRVEQVILNLLANALDALKSVDAPRIDVEFESDADRVTVHVRDNGHGIPPAIAERITEPFFTTKVTGEGLGLGLSISRSIIAEFGGELAFHSSPAGGCTFSMTLPASGAQTALAAE